MQQNLVHNNNMSLKSALDNRHFTPTSLSARSDLLGVLLPFITLLHLWYMIHIFPSVRSWMEESTSAPQRSGNRMKTHSGYIVQDRLPGLLLIIQLTKETLRDEASSY